jgi:hypothetical protein
MDYTVFAHGYMVAIQVMGTFFLHFQTVLHVLDLHWRHKEPWFSDKFPGLLHRQFRNMDGRFVGEAGLHYLLAKSELQGSERLLRWGIALRPPSQPAVEAAAPTSQPDGNGDRNAETGVSDLDQLIVSWAEAHGQTTTKAICKVRQQFIGHLQQRTGMWRKFRGLEDWGAGEEDIAPNGTGPYANLAGSAPALLMVAKEYGYVQGLKRLNEQREENLFEALSAEY